MSNNVVAWMTDEPEPRTCAAHQKASMPRQTATSYSIPLIRDTNTPVPTPSYAAYTKGEMERVNALLFAARSEAASLGMATIVSAIDGVRSPLTAKLRGDAVDGGQP